MNSLSLCCLIRDPPERVVPILEAVRPFADEIVVAVDAASPGAASGMLDAVADQLYRVSFEPPFEQYLPWLHSLCGGDWIFRIDGDEVPSAALLASLPWLLDDQPVLQYRIPRRWLFRDGDHWLAQEPWQPDYQIRLVRNDPATLRFRGTLHSSAEPALPARYLAEPIYHLALLVATREEREQRVHEYESLPGAPAHVDNAGYYLPDLRQDLFLDVTPAEDRALVKRALVGTAEPSARAPIVAPTEVPLRDVLRVSPRRELGAGTYDVEITCLEDRVRLVSGHARLIPVRVRNRGKEAFPWGDWWPQIRLAYHWLTTAGEEVIREGHRTFFASDLAPGEEQVVPLFVVPPAEPGKYLLEIDLVHERVRWFDCAICVAVVVESAPETFARAATIPISALQRLICVTGMHRSGTSLVARIVNLLGIHIGDTDDLIVPSDDNPAGFWEHREFVALNDDLLVAMGGSAASPPRLAEGWETAAKLDPLRDRAERLVRRLADGHPAAGWKDPRTSLTLPFWRTVAPVDSTVLVLRHPLEVVESFAARNGMPEDAICRLYVRYTVAAIQNDAKCIVVRHDELFEDLERAVDRLARSLRLDAPGPATLDRVRTFVDPALRHARFEMLEGQGPAAVALSVYKLLSEGGSETVRALSAALIQWSLAADPA